MEKIIKFDAEARAVNLIGVSTLCPETLDAYVDTPSSMP